MWKWHPYDRPGQGMKVKARETEQFANHEYDTGDQEECLPSAVRHMHNCVHSTLPQSVQLRGLVRFEV